MLFFGILKKSNLVKYSNNRFKYHLRSLYWGKKMEEVKQNPNSKKNRRMKLKNTQDELNALTKEELIERIIKLDSYNMQLKNTITKKFTEKLEGGKVREKQREFDFTNRHKRHILLKFCYLGWDYSGFVTQDGGLETIELHLFNGLKKVCLIESRETSNYNRCGRTDKGVSAFSQVVSIDIRSRFEPKDQLTAEGVSGEIDYCDLLNKVLPRDIRAIAWMPLITSEFSARFDCIERGYKYFFPRGNLDIDLMLEASQHFVGTHDFRNFCKMDIQHGVVTYIRRINKVEINLVQKNETEDYDMFCVDIKGSGFLWHMIRSIMTVLIIIGDKKETPDLVKNLLDIEKQPAKPQYYLASEIPLNLFFCNFREDVLGEDDLPRHADYANKWIYHQFSMQFLIINIQEHWCLQNVKSTMIYEMLKELQQTYHDNFPDQPTIKRQPVTLCIDIKKANYINLEQRPTASSLEERLEFRNKKQKMNPKEEEKCENIDID